MHPKSAGLVRLLVRVGLVALVAWLIVGNLQFDDTLRLRDDSVLRGRVEALASGDFEVHGDTVRTVERGDVAVRKGEVPDVAYGLKTLARRVGDRPLDGVLVLLVLGAVAALMGWRWHRLLRAVELEVSLLDAVRLTFIGGFFNTVVPGSTGGDVVKAWYAAKRTKRGTRAVLSVIVDRLMGLVTLLLLASVALAVIRRGDALADARLAVILIWVATVGGLTLLVSPRLRRWLGLEALARRLPFQRVVSEVAAAARLYSEHPATLLFAFGLSLINQVAIASVVWWLARALEIDGVTWIACLALVPLANLFSAIPLVPGGWGVGELAFVWLFAPLGVAPTEAIGLSVVYRLSFLLVNLPGGLLWILQRDAPAPEEMAARVSAATEHVRDAEPRPE